MRDRDAIFGDQVKRQLIGMGIQEVLTAPRSRWQSPYVERLIGSFVEDNKSAVLWRSPLCGVRPDHTVAGTLSRA